jgi:hypothetical protein
MPAGEIFQRLVRHASGRNLEIYWLFVRHASGRNLEALKIQRALAERRMTRKKMSCTEKGHLIVLLNKAMK